MKTKEEINALKKEVEELKGKLSELTEQELAEVTGGHGTLIPEDLAFDAPDGTFTAPAAAPGNGASDYQVAERLRGQVDTAMRR